MSTHKPRLTIYLSSAELLDEIQAVAETEKRSVSNLTSIALTEWIADHKAGRNNKSAISADDIDQFKKFIALLLGERERNGVSFVLLGQALDIDPEKLHELYMLVQQCRKEHKQKASR
ncbi:MAG TPA: hypothetical protein VE944_26650 [Nostoc sp.]|uniref:hypothetical protein n=1 Tax=Nostoc sp. TaxID=1180 RepID=UPI002D2E4FC7|nr:hypothetical protein [Nostoc sp.]HYX17875.1 hypothetical protein [Nostoc sp.]